LGEGNEVLIAGYSKNDAKNVAISVPEVGPHDAGENRSTT